VLFAFFVVKQLIVGLRIAHCEAPGGKRHQFQVFRGGRADFGAALGAKLDGADSGVARFGAQASPGWCKAVVPFADLRRIIPLKA